METKGRVRLELKSDGPEGAFRVILAKHNVVDHDGDVTFAGAFEKGMKIPLAPVGHNWDEPTIGMGVIDWDPDHVYADGLFNLKMASGREHYESAKFDKEQGVNRQEYSYAYSVKKAITRPDELKAFPQFPGVKRILQKVEPHEMSMVLLGAGIGTGTAWIKGRRTGRKAAPLSDEQKRELIQSAVRKQDQAADIAAGEEPGYGGPWIVDTYSDHVIVQDDDGDGYLSIPFTLAADGTVTLGTPSPVERVWTAKAADIAAMKYADQAEHVLADVQAFTARSKSLADLRAKVGRELSTANRERISKTVSAARAAADDLEALLSEADAVVADPAKGRVRAALIEARLAEMQLLLGATPASN